MRFLLLLFACAYLPLSSQTLVNPDNRWITNYCYYSWDEWSSGSKCDTVLQFFGDTITIEQKTYRKLVSLSVNDIWWQPTSYDYYREEGGSIYARWDNSDSEDLVFDFTLTQGDTFYLPRDYNQERPIWVDSTYTLQLSSGKQRKALDLSTFFFSSEVPAFWIDGVGSVAIPGWPGNSGGTLNSNYTFITDIWDDLLCYYVTDTLELDYSYQGCDPYLNDLSIFIENPWLDDYIDIFDCEASSVTVYKKESHNYFYVTFDDIAQLYFEDGTFYCQDDTDNDCRSIYELTEIVDEWHCEELTSLDVVSEQDQITVYPNPTRDLIYIEGLIGHYKVGVYDTTGQFKFQTTKYGNSEIDLSSLSSGMYLLHIKNESQNIIEKIHKSN